MTFTTRFPSPSLPGLPSNDNASEALKRTPIGFIMDQWNNAIDEAGSTAQVRVGNPDDVINTLNNPVDPGTTQEELINNILSDADGRPIRKLIVSDHASPGSQTLTSGDTKMYLTPETLDLEQWSRLNGQFAEGGMIRLDGCKVAAGEEGQRLLQAMAVATGVPVQGGIVNQRTMIPGGEGTTVTAYPDGRIEVDKSWGDNVWGPIDELID